eukprot:1158345-Pelagomonas_calceolata.AAC.1
MEENVAATIGQFEKQLESSLRAAAGFYSQKVEEHLEILAHTAGLLAHVLCMHTAAALRWSKGSWRALCSKQKAYILCALTAATYGGRAACRPSAFNLQARWLMCMKFVTITYTHCSYNRMNEERLEGLQWLARYLAGKRQKGWLWDTEAKAFAELRRRGIECCAHHGEALTKAQGHPWL